MRSIKLWNRKTTFRQFYVNSIFQLTYSVKWVCTCELLFFFYWTIQNPNLNLTFVFIFISFIGFTVSKSHCFIPYYIYYIDYLDREPLSEFNEFEPRLKSAKNRSQLSAGLNLENLNTIINGTNNI